MNIVNSAGQALEGSGAPEIPAFKLKSNEALLVRTGLGDPAGFTFFPDLGVSMVPGACYFPVIYWFEEALDESDGGLFIARDYRAFGVPMQFMVVPKPEWWAAREKRACAGIPFYWSNTFK